MADETRDPIEARQEAPGMPRWVKAFVAVGIVLIALLVVTQFVGGGHGPGRHGGGDTPSSTEHVPPPEHAP